MIDSVIKVEKKGLIKIVSGPSFGRQHQGVSPGGAMDLFSCRIGHKLLNIDTQSESLEIVIAPGLRFIEDAWFVLTGARYDRITIGNKHSGAELTEVGQAEVCFARKGDELVFGNKIRGFRTYLSCVPAGQEKSDISGRRRAEYADVYNWADDEGLIRLVEGPEFQYLTDQKMFTGTHWTITNEFSDMGFRLSTSSQLPRVSLKNMISAPVADGTIQLAPKGPIILLKQRQTVGGYPRIYNVISADVDLLAQYGPNQILRFKAISIDQALSIARKKEEKMGDPSF